MLLSTISDLTTPFYSPHIFNGASSSSRIGCWRKSSLDLRQSPRTSASVIWTVLPGLLPLTAMKNSRSENISTFLSHKAKETNNAFNVQPWKTDLKVRICVRLVLPSRSL